MKSKIYKNCKNAKKSDKQRSPEKYKIIDFKLIERNDEKYLLIFFSEIEKPRVLYLVFKTMIYANFFLQDRVNYAKNYY